MKVIAIVGGLVPPILINQENMLDVADSHVGNMDLDIGLALAIFDKKYQAITDRLRSAKFFLDINE